jgi:hypothetical protein
MRRDWIDDAVMAAAKFTELARQLKYHPTETRHPYQEPVSNPKLTGAVRRASMELTRALAEMRKGING